MNRHSGFTLIELVVVIVILGILAATAIPKFVDLSSDARKSVLDGIVGAANSAAVMAHAQWLAKGGNAAVTSVSFEGTAVSVNSSGYPTAAAAGIEAAMKGLGGATASYASPVATFTLQTNCTATYNETTGVAQRGVDTGC